MGMSASEYWHGDPRLVIDYRKADETRREIRNQELWLQGLYNYKALQAVISQVLAKPGTQPEMYLEAPIAFTENEKAAEKQRMIEKTLKWVAEGQKNGNKG